MAHAAHPDFQRRQHFRPRRRIGFRRVLFRYQVIELFIIIGAILLLWGGSSLVQLSSAINQTPSTWLESVRIDVIDGVSIRSGEQVYRLIGYDTPESGDNAKCPRERALSAEATRRLRQIVASGELDLRRVPCACPRGTEGTGRCNYGQFCGTLRVRGQDVGAILIAEGLAERSVCAKNACPPRKGWCAS